MTWERGAAPGEEWREAYTEGMLPSTPAHVPLTIYIGDERKVIGKAVVTGNRIEAYITPADEPEALTRMFEAGILQNMTVTFNAPPAVPVYGANGHIRWKKDY